MAADSGRLREACDSAHTGRGQGHPDTSHRVPKRPSGRFSARRPCPQVPQGHPRVAKHHLTDLRMVPFRCTSRSSARLPRPQVLQRHPVVANGASGRSSTWRSCPQVPQSHPRVAKHHLTDLRMVPSRCTSRSSARRQCPQVQQMTQIHNKRYIRTGY